MGVSRSARVIVALVILTVSGFGPGSAAPAEIDRMVAALVEAGIDRSSIVVQDSRLNYAGPECPGSGWSCVPAGIVVQRSVEGANVFECGPPEDATATPTSCSVVQSSSGGTNLATCEQFSDDDPGNIECSIQQQNTTGPNQATVLQAVSQSADGDAVVQVASATAVVDQSNGSGSNILDVDQSALQVATAEALLQVSHEQNATMCVSLDQNSGDGDNTATIHQEHAATSELSNVLIADQRQQNRQLTAQPCADGGLTDPSEFPNLHVRSLQFASGVGALDLGIDQSMSLTQEAASLLGPIDQLQGPAVPFSGGGVTVELDGDTNGPDSTYEAHLDKDWRQEAGTLGSVTQVQNDRQALSGLGLRQGQRSYDDCIWSLNTQLQGSHNPEQTFLQKAMSHCTESTHGTITNTLQGEESTETFTGEFVNETRTSGGPTAPPSGPGPFPHLHKAVVNSTEGESFEGPESPNATEAVPDDAVGFLLTAHNHGEAVATGVTLTDEIPPDSTFAGCLGGCVLAGTGQTGDQITWALPDIPPGGTAVVSFEVRLDPEGQDYSTLPTTIVNTAWLDIAEEPPVPSNEVSVNVLGVSSGLAKEVRALNCGPSDEGCDPDAWGTAADAETDEIVEYRLTYTNDGGITATDVVVHDRVPDHTTFWDCDACGESAGGDPPASGSGPGTYMYWELGDIAPGGSVSVTFEVLVDANDSPGWSCSPAASPVDNAIENVGASDTAEEANTTVSNATTVTVPIDCGFISTDAVIARDGGSLGFADGSGEDDDELLIVFSHDVALGSFSSISFAGTEGPVTVVCDDDVSASCDAVGASLTVTLYDSIGLSYPLTVVGSDGITSETTGEAWSLAHSSDLVVDGAEPGITLHVTNLDTGFGGSHVDAEAGDTLRFSIVIENAASAPERILLGSYWWLGDLPYQTTGAACTGCGSWFEDDPGEVEWYSSGPHPALLPGTGIVATYDVTVDSCAFSESDVFAYLDTEQAGSFESNPVSISLFDPGCEFD